MENLDENNKNVSLSLIADYGTSDSESDGTETPSIENAESEDGELSEMVLKNNIINACAHGPLANRDADEEASRHMFIESAENGALDYEVTEYRVADSSSDSDSSDSDVDSVKDVEELSSSDETETNIKSGKLETPKVQGELGLDDLPPIEDLAISLPSQETTKIGTVASIVDRLVVVRAFPQTPAVDLDSVLFLENGAKALGKVFDVFGQVTEPHYCVRFNSPEHVRERGVQPGMEVYIAPKNEQHTNYVLLSQLMKLKGSDASWMDDTEPPPSHVEYSDDEEERRARRGGGGGERAERGGEARRHQRPSESSSRFGSGPSRGRNPFSQRRPNYPRAGPPPPGRAWPAPPLFPPPFNPAVPPPFHGYQFGAAPRMAGPHMPPPHFPGVFGASYCTASGPQPQWVNAAPPPPPGT